ncbi:hypothetical protein GRI62_11375 [Erythrobacter arachoides]|uniref:Regulatory protein RecX n=1 Tax=Aurantiacibacter arachoides TaxID=1850444 RepID=A0A845A230_9SPHN|nr:RecX family transcriptional regulator [Aurantiacibacter arachoides]MXO94195.1 hypothetical protein [Aurantiacibacter arachoides]GGD65369.1 recombinase RecX [Aurantiacibacter arachoides]
MAYSNGKRAGPRPRKPLDRQSLEDLALSYAARYATSSAKLARYLERKLFERGWAAEDEPDLPALVARFVEKRYVDDEAFARARSSDLLRRGYGGRRVRQSLGQAGIAEKITARMAPGEHAAREAALQMARKRRIGPFAPEPVAPEKREKQIAAMLRAGHRFDHVRAVLDCRNEDAAAEWLLEARDTQDDGFA